MLDELDLDAIITSPTNGAGDSQDDGGDRDLAGSGLARHREGSQDRRIVPGHE